MRNLDEISRKQYWTTAEAVAVLGRGRLYILAQFDAGRIGGHWTGGGNGRGHRRINADSARRFFAGIDKTRGEVSSITGTERIAMFRRSLKAQRGQDA